MLAELEVHAPAILAAASIAYDKATRDADFIRLDAATFATVPKTSIDFAVMERTTKAGVTPYGSDWSDIGSWDASLGGVRPRMPTATCFRATYRRSACAQPRPERGLVTAVSASRMSWW